MPNRSKNQRKINIVLCGAGGRMGQLICELAPRYKVKIVAAVNSDRDWHAIPPGRIDAIVDFSNPKGFSEALRWSQKKGCRFLSGTTGLTMRQQQQLKRASEKAAVFWSPNMSLGISWMEAMIDQLAALRSWDFSLEETHHKFKKDKPSGTALMLQHKLEQTIRKRIARPHSIRVGGVFGIHKIICATQEETITIEHTALDRRVFARGTLLALQFVCKKSRGFYSMSDLIGAKYG